jgi:hypothetical protein
MRQASSVVPLWSNGHCTRPWFSKLVPARHSCYRSWHHNHHAYFSNATEESYIAKGVVQIPMSQEEILDRQWKRRATFTMPPNTCSIAFLKMNSKVKTEVLQKVRKIVI